MSSVWVRVILALALVAAGVALIATGCGPGAAKSSGKKDVSTDTAGASRQSDRHAKEGSKQAASKPSKPKDVSDKPRFEPGEELVRAAWGSGASDLGHTRPTEGAPEGPMGFSVGADGTLVMLDQVNSRLVVRPPGGTSRVISLPADTYQDVEMDGRGGFIVLDRLATQTVTFLDKDGHVKHSLPLVGPGIVAGGMVTGLFARADGIWIEVEHRTSVRIADAAGVADPARPMVVGRFSSDGRWLLSATLDVHRAVHIEVRPAKSATVVFEKTVSFREPVFGIFELDADAAGRVVLVVHTLYENLQDAAKIEAEHVVAVMFGADGKEVGRRFLRVPTLPEEQFRPIRVGSDGSVYQFVLADKGATIERFGP